MLDFDIQRCSRKCAVTGRELVPGEVFYSVLITEGGEIIRKDYAVSAWSGAPENSLGSWRARVPDQSTPKLVMAPHDLILQLFEELLNQGSSPELCYVLALLMVRRKIARIEETVKEVGGGDVLVIYSPKSEREYRVPVSEPPAARVPEIQEQISRLLFSGGDP